MSYAHFFSTLSTKEKNYITKFIEWRIYYKNNKFYETAFEENKKAEKTKLAKKITSTFFISFGAFCDNLNHEQALDLIKKQF